MEQPFHCAIVSEAWPPTAGPGALVTVMGGRTSRLQPYFCCRANLVEPDGLALWGLASVRHGQWTLGALEGAGSQEYLQHWQKTDVPYRDTIRDAERWEGGRPSADV